MSSLKNLRRRRRVPPNPNLVSSPARPSLILGPPANQLDPWSPPARQAPDGPAAHNKLRILPSLSETKRSPPRQTAKKTGRPRGSLQGPTGADKEESAPWDGEGFWNQMIRPPRGMGRTFFPCILSLVLRSWFRTAIGRLCGDSTSYTKPQSGWSGLAWRDGLYGCTGTHRSAPIWGAFV